VEKLNEFMRTGLGGVVVKIVFEALVLIVLLYGWMQTMDVRFSHAEEMEKDLAVRVLMLEKGAAFREGTVSTEMKNLADQVNKLDGRIASIEAYIRTHR
jgi:ATP/maltotriose-dependent transcriptional regulator MalT